MIIAINKRTNAAFEVYPNYADGDVKKFMHDLDYHGFICISENEGIVKATVYGETKYIEKGTALIIGHPEGVSTHTVLIMSIEEVRNNFVAYNGNQFLKVISKEGQEAVMLNPMLVKHNQLFESLSTFFEYGLKCYGSIVNNTVSSVNKIEYGKSKIRLTEEGLMYFVFFDRGGKLVIESLTQNTFNLEWKLAPCNEWLRFKYSFFLYDLTIERTKSAISCTIDEMLEASEVAILLQRLGFSEIKREIIRNDEGDSYQIIWLTIGKKKVIVSLVRGSEVAAPLKLVLKIKDDEIVKRDVNVGSTLTELYESFEDKEEAKEYFETLLGFGIKKSFSKTMLSTLKIKPTLHFTMDGDLIEDWELSGFLSCEENMLDVISQQNPRYCDNEVINNIRMSEVDKSL